MLSVETDFFKSSLLAIVTLLACAEKLSSTMNDISLSRDWVSNSAIDCDMLVSSLQVVVIAGDSASDLQGSAMNMITS